jgi:hypothetical protein
MMIASFIVHLFEVSLTHHTFRISKPKNKIHTPVVNLKETKINDHSVTNQNFEAINFANKLSSIKKIRKFQTALFELN